MNKTARTLAALFFAASLSNADAENTETNFPPRKVLSESGAPRNSHVLLVEPARRFKADGFSWDHEIQIALPSSYSKTSRTYPVLWVTDGSMFFDMAVRIVSAESAQNCIPEMIVVGIGAPADGFAEVGMRRTYDFTPTDVTRFDGFGSDLIRQLGKSVEEKLKAAGKPTSSKQGGAPGFNAFLLDSLRPALAREYRMNEEHTLFGNSDGGLFCTYALLARPAGFSKYICGSPTLNRNNSEVFRMEERYARANGDLSASVFFGAGESEVLAGGVISAVGVVSSMTRMAEILKARSYPGLKLHVRIFPGKDHGTVIPMNLKWGLRTLSGNDRNLLSSSDTAGGRCTQD